MEGVVVIFTIAFKCSQSLSSLHVFVEDVDHHLLPQGCFY